ncbi:hypothetical protein LPJ66_005719, partial [Kickxella alabastrina]
QQDRGRGRHGADAGRRRAADGACAGGHGAGVPWPVQLRGRLCVLGVHEGPLHGACLAHVRCCGAPLCACPRPPGTDCPAGNAGPRVPRHGRPAQLRCPARPQRTIHAGCAAQGRSRGCRGCRGCSGDAAAGRPCAWGGALLQNL